MFIKTRVILLFIFAFEFCVNSLYAVEYKTYITPDKNYIEQNKAQKNYYGSNSQFKHDLYLGLGVGKTISAFSKFKADYKEKLDAWLAPGFFQKSEFESDESLNIQVLLGTHVTQNFRIEFTYLHYSDLSLKLKSHSLLSIDENLTSHTGEYKFDKKPDISADLAMLNIYYYLDRLIGSFKVRPYIGAGIGLSQNVISDYIVFDGGAYIIPGMQDTLQEPGTPIRVSDIKTRHKGNTVGNFTFSFELGASYNLTENCIVDVFGRYINLGTVESDGVVSTYNLFVSTSNDIPVGNIYNTGAPAGETTSYYPDWKEKGNLNVVDIGLKLRFLF